MSPWPEHCEAGVLVAMSCYRCPELTIDAVRSLEQNRQDVPGLQVGICENGSGDEVVQTLTDTIEREGWDDWVYVLPVSPNRGFAGGTNVVLRDGLGWAKPPDYFLLLNTDTIVHPGAVRSLVEAMRRRPEVGVMSARLFWPDGTPQTCEFIYMSPVTELLRAASTGLFNRMLGYEPCELHIRNGRRKTWLGLAGAMIPREVLLEVGLLDEGYYLYFDDIDYSRRVQAAGWHLAFCDKARITHLEGQSNPLHDQQRKRARRPRYYYESRSRYFAKYAGRIGLTAANLAWLVGRSVSWLRSATMGKRTGVCEREWLDLWANWLDPVGRSESNMRHICAPRGH